MSISRLIKLIVAVTGDSDPEMSSIQFIPEKILY